MYRSWVVDTKQINTFKSVVYDYYHSNGRHNLPWRQFKNTSQLDPYRVLVSEIMLQQTQVQRVVPKFNNFIKRFPTITALADANLSDVLIEWSGLGYNRRAKFLYQAAQKIQTELAGVFPKTLDQLEKLPGIGKNTAAAIVAYSFNIPVTFIETNIRSVYLHHFFPNEQAVSDKELLPIIVMTLDQSNPREWYWALMDYGSYLKSTIVNPSRRSKHHLKQANFIGSKRQIRGQVLKMLISCPVSLAQLKSNINDPRLERVVKELENEQLISKKNSKYILGK